MGAAWRAGRSAARTPGARPIKAKLDMETRARTLSRFNATPKCAPVPRPFRLQKAVLCGSFRPSPALPRARHQCPRFSSGIKSGLRKFCTIKLRSIRALIILNEVRAILNEVRAAANGAAHQFGPDSRFQHQQFSHDISRYILMLSRAWLVNPFACEVLLRRNAL